MAPFFVRFGFGEMICTGKIEGLYKRRVEYFTWPGFAFRCPDQIAKNPHA
jgi:hypothetical protein